MVVLQVQNDEDRKKRRKGVKPTMLDQSYYETANEIISRYPLEEKSLIPIIQDIQATYRYLPPDLLDYVAKKIGITETKAYSVASFYENFSFEQKGKYVLKIATERPAMSANPRRCCSTCVRNWDSVRPSRPPMT